jgi:hypothetical protein
MPSLLQDLENDIAIAQDAEFSTENLQVPVGEYPGSITRISRRKFNSNGDDFFCLNVTWELDSDDAREAIQSPKAFIDQTIFLRLDTESSKFLGEGGDANEELWVPALQGNPDFAKLIKWAQAEKYEMRPSWGSFWLNLKDDLAGREAMVKVAERYIKLKSELDDDGNPVKVLRSFVRGIRQLD